MRYKPLLISYFILLPSYIKYNALSVMKVLKHEIIFNRVEHIKKVVLLLHCMPTSSLFGVSRTGRQVQPGTLIQFVQNPKTNKYFSFPSHEIVCNVFMIMYVSYNENRQIL